MPPTKSAPAPRRPSGRSRCRATLLSVYNWSVWGLLALLLGSQVLVVVWNSVTFAQRTLYGQAATEAKYTVPGDNDEPYVDRVIVCASDGYTYRPMQLSDAIKQSSNSSDWTTNGIDGYRVIVRESNVITDLGFAALSTYSHMCDTLALTMDAILDACDALGYNVSRDVLRVVHGLDTNRVTVLPSVLPVLWIPLWDRALNGRFVVPGQDGSACVFRGTGLFMDETRSFAYMTATTRNVRETQTVEWLGLPGGAWKNGWYEDPGTKSKWHMDVLSTVRDGDTRHLPLVQFDLLSKDPASAIQCPDYNAVHCVWQWGTDSWGTQRSTITVRSDGFVTVVVSNGSRYGLFQHDSDDVVTVTSTYGLDQLVANVTVMMLLARWLVALFVLLSGSNTTIGVGALANAPSFRLLPVLLLPRLKSTLEAFWSSGCHFEGAQRALGESWFVVYPAIAETVLVYFSVINTLAKVLRRRVTDVLFGPTLLLFGLLHYGRYELAASTRLGFDGRVTTVVTAEEVDAAFLTAFFTSDLAFRLNGRVVSLFVFKVAVLVLNLVPLVVGSRRVASAGTSSAREGGIETAIAMRLDRNGGLGLGHRLKRRRPGKDPVRSRGKDDGVLAFNKGDIIENERCEGVQSTAGVSPYELVRAGYVVVDARNRSVAPAISLIEAETPSQLSQLLSATTVTSPLLVVSIDHWLWLLVARARLVVRVGIFEACFTASETTDDGEALALVTLVDTKPRMYYLNDPRFRNVRPWRIATCAVE